MSNPPVGQRFDSERGTEAINARWAAERERKAELEREVKNAAVEALIALTLEAAEQYGPLLRSENETIRLRALDSLLDRVLGRALERHEHAGPEGSSLLRADIDPERLEVMLKELAGRNGHPATNGNQ